MIPIHLSISGFLSYRDPVEIDFTTFELACIAGPNGAGKSSLLDSITWALFGQARKRDDSLINTLSTAAEVTLIFAYEGNVYRVLRAKRRDKTAALEFHILQDPPDQDQLAAPDDSAEWRPLTERSLRETEARIQNILRLDYETFVNASFFLQGKADQFTQQRPGDRKRILSTILALEIWEIYRKRAAESRRSIEDEIVGVDGRLQEILAELAEEENRRERLEQLLSDLKRLGEERKARDEVLANIRQVAASLEEQQKAVNAFARQVEAAGQQMNTLETRLDERRQERDSFTDLLARAGQIEAAFTAWQATRAELERWEETASRFRKHEKRREGPRAEIGAARARLEGELGTLQEQERETEAILLSIADFSPKIEQAQAEQAALEERLKRKKQLDDDLGAARQRHAEARAENPRLKAAMNELKTRIDQLKASDGAECPLCGQPLNSEDRQSLIDKLDSEGTEMGDRYRANQTLLSDAKNQVSELEAKIFDLSQVEAALRNNTQALAELTSHYDRLSDQKNAWEKTGAPRAQEITLALEKETYAPEARATLAEIDSELKEIGYDAAEHDAIRQAELEGRASEEEMRTLDKAQAALAPLEREIADLESSLEDLLKQAAAQEQEHQAAAAALAEAQAGAPDLEAAEQALRDAQELENRLRLEVGAAQQEVLVLDDLKQRRASLEAQREELAQQVGEYKQLERAFGKDGVPALLIEQALPEIEAKANEVLDRLSEGNMSVRFITQAKYKDARRDDLRETLDIQISDSAGTRDYEMYSGGEAFRVNFAIRLALSEVLAQRAGARLQTLVIDEGFGSQDAQGRQRLIEAINLVRADFAKVLVITHIDELKDAFPNRIDVEKTERGSTVQVI